MTKKILKQLSTEEIIHGCQKESRQKAETGYCFELFCRALEQQNEQAWAAIEKQYHKLVLGWLHNLSNKSLIEEESLTLAQDTFVKFWRCTKNKHKPLSDKHFEHMGAIMKYLQQCALTAYLDFQRRTKREARLEQKVTVHLQEKPLTTTMDEMVGQTKKSEQLQAIREWVQKSVTDQREQLVLYLAYDQGLPPATIVAQYPQDFATVREVRRVKERVLKRARRALVG